MYTVCSILIAGFLVGVTSAVDTPIVILDTDPGIRYDPTSQNAPVRLDVMLETNCPDSNDSWPYLKEVAEFYGPAQLDLVIYQFQLPYHRWGQLCTMGYFAVQSLQSDADALIYMEYVMARYDQYSSGATRQNTHVEMLDQLAIHANEATGVDIEQFKLTTESNAIWSHAQRNWKAACRRLAAGTPWYYLNGVDIGVNYALTTTELQELIDPLLD